jgi:signal transduction histidine kinase
MWDEDFSAVKSLIDYLARSGISNIAEYLRGDADAVRDCVARVHVRHVNRVAREFYGAESEQHLIAALPSLFDDAALVVFREEVIAFVKGSPTFQADLSVTILNGERRRVVMNVSLLDAPRGDWSKVVVTFTDITERRRLEQSLKSANESLRRLNQHLERFAYAAAHDLREPLRTIGLYAQLLQRQQKPEPGSGSEMSIGYILENAKRMETLVDDLLTFAKAVEPSYQDADGGDADPHVVIAEALSSLSKAVQDSSAQVHVDTDIPMVPMQAIHLRQVFQNLLSNAIKYHAVDQAPMIHVSGKTVADEVTLCVSDNGIGIRSDYHEQVFGIFKRLHGHEIEGNGIGLALCRKIVEDYRGRIWVESVPGEGSSFYFTIPRRVLPD